jgi:carnitine 3-dehydrogenase
MTESRYGEVLADATDAFLLRTGMFGDYLDSGRSYFTVETHIRYLLEANAGERLYVATRLLHHDVKRLHLWHELHRRGDDALLATGEHMLLHVDRNAGRTAPAGDSMLAALTEIAGAQDGLPWPAPAGSRIGGGRSKENL